MQKNMFRKTLAIGLIVLFIGVGIHPTFAVETKQSIVNKENEEDCYCKEVSDTDLIKVERLLNRAEVYTKLLPVITGYNPEIKDKIIDISHEISKFTKISEDLTRNRFPIICNISLDLFIQFEDIVSYFDNLSYNYQKNPILSSIADICAGIMAFCAISIYIIAREFGCAWAPNI